jgi:radical SAM protein with 4Fe4S-binding SPASM domain
MSVSETINKNTNRKKPILDRDPQFHNNVVIPSWIELSLIDACNRKCVFCPKVDDSIAPDTYQKMELSLINKLVDDLKKINFQGAFCLCGYGEPMLHKDVITIINKLGEVGGVEIVTNGDLLNEKIILDLYNSKLSQILVSMYDGPDQKVELEKIIKKTDIPYNFITLRERWHKDDNYGLGAISNRAGNIKVDIDEDTKVAFKNKKCFYTAYQTTIDWDGNVYVCPNDWNRKISMGNVMQKNFFDIWNGKFLSKYRRELLNGKRNSSPCNVCNVDGTVYGTKHHAAWTKKR